MMDHVVFLVLRRMRTPLLALVIAYAVAVAGLVLIPGQDDSGALAPMGFFHAFYFVAYMSTTIGFGEIPHAFTDAQRLWVSFCVFATVAVWIYALGALIALFQEPALQRAIARRRFVRQVAGLREPFYLICGHGQTGGALVSGLTDRHQRAVAIDIDPDCISALSLQSQREFVPALCADARRPGNLEDAGLGHPYCQGVVALTNVNEVNLKVAIAAKLLRPEIQVICRAESHEIAANMASFGTDHIYDPFDTFALYLSIALQARCLTPVYDWLRAPTGTPLREPLNLPESGRWVLCGYGRFGKAVYRHLKRQGLALTVIEAEPHRTGIPAEGVVHGRGTEAVTLEEASIREAVGLVAGTDDDANNLSIIMTALALNRDLFVVARQNHHDNNQLFARAGAHLVMQPSSVVADRIRVRLTTPLLSDFFALSRDQEDEWACELLSRLVALVEDRSPHVWQVTLDREQAAALALADAQGRILTCEDLLRDPRAREQRLPALILMHEHGDSRHLLPGPRERLFPGDRLLLCGQPAVADTLCWTLRQADILHYVQTGETAPQGALWRRWEQARQRRRGS